MSNYTLFINPVTEKRNPVKVGILVKRQYSKLQFNRAMQNLLGQSDMDYFNLRHVEKPVKSASNASEQVAAKARNFFANGKI